ncbi:hypothetical protein LXA43DRAFT_950794 [Ganoderma leucocontextum]|nr:hypothetical protein LXA43DRAFT_950794 [Ganoderma leucocontextum]
MQREDYRCIVTRILDYAYALGLRTPNGGMYDGDVDSLDICRIFPSSLNADLEQSEKTRDSCANVWRVLNSLGYTDIFSCFATANKIHSLENIMVVTKSLLYRFDRLKTWFEPVEGIPNCYQICSILKPPRGLINGQWVTFQSSDPRLPLPNCEFLRIHAACCRVAHQSGASDLFYELERDLESNPNPTMELADFAKVLHVHLESLSDSSTHVDAD